MPKDMRRQLMALEIRLRLLRKERAVAMHPKIDPVWEAMWKAGCCLCDAMRLLSQEKARADKEAGK